MSSKICVIKKWIGTVTEFVNVINTAVSVMFLPFLYCISRRRMLCSKCETTFAIRCNRKWPMRDGWSIVGHDSISWLFKVTTIYLSVHGIRYMSPRSLHLPDRQGIYFILLCCFAFNVFCSFEQLHTYKIVIWAKHSWVVIWWHNVQCLLSFSLSDVLNTRQTSRTCRHHSLFSAY